MRKFKHTWKALVAVLAIGLSSFTLSDFQNDAQLLSDEGVAVKGGSVDEVYESGKLPDSWVFNSSKESDLAKTNELLAKEGGQVAAKWAAISIRIRIRLTTRRISHIELEGELEFFFVSY